LVLLLASSLAALGVACGARTELASEGSEESDAGSRDSGSLDAEGGFLDVSPDSPSDRMPSDSSEPEIPLDACIFEASCPPGYTMESCAECVASSFAVTESALYGVKLPEGTVQLIGPTGGHSLTNIALDSAGNLLGVSEKFLYSVDPMTGTPTLIGPVADSPNALGFGPDGTLYSAGTTAAAASVIFTIDPKTGTETLLAPYPLGYMSSGDVAVVGRTLYATAAGGSEDELATLDLDTLAGNIIGPIGFACVWGLAASGGTLFGFTCMGHIIQIDPTTAVGTLVSTPGESFSGAATR
jgi:hypothetical protein